MSGETTTKRVSERRVGSFVLLEKLGEGGLGEVWKARDRRLNRVVALKFILSQEKTGYDLAREARAASALNHPNIVTILEIGESGGGTYIAMEFVEGETLRGRLGRSRVPYEAAIDIVTQVARTLAAAHRHGIVHRDVKPENVMIRMDGYVKLVDFGLAKVLPWSESVTNQSSTQTETGQIVGTVSYMSPEQARGQPVGPASDVFSFGIVLYELLTGEHPFRTDNPIDTLHRIINTEPAGTRARCPEAPAEIHGIVERCLKKDKTQRFQTAAGIEVHLRMVNAAPQQTKKRPRWPPPAAAIVVAIALVLLLLMWNPFSNRPGNPVTVRSVAVMTVRTAAEDPVAEVLAQGLSEQLGGSLAREGFLVAPRSRVLALSGPADAQSVGRQLGVDAILEGSLTNANNERRLYVELVDARTGFQIWSQSTVLPAGGFTAVSEIARELRSAAGSGR